MEESDSALPYIPLILLFSALIMVFVYTIGFGAGTAHGKLQILKNIERHGTSFGPEEVKTTKQLSMVVR